MQGWRKTVVWLVLLWLPVQGFAAGLMPFTCHAHRPASAATPVQHADQMHQHDAHAHHGHDQAAQDDGVSHELGCDNCTLCQMCGAAALTGTVVKDRIPLVDGVTASPLTKLASFIPALPHRPPRA